MRLLKCFFVALLILIIVAPIVGYGYLKYNKSSLEKETYKYLRD